jgi:hypothetical protein
MTLKAPAQFADIDESKIKVSDRKPRLTEGVHKIAITNVVKVDAKDGTAYVIEGQKENGEEVCVDYQVSKEYKYPGGVVRNYGVDRFYASLRSITGAAKGAKINDMVRQVHEAVAAGSPTTVTVTARPKLDATTKVPILSKSGEPVMACTISKSL